MSARKGLYTKVEVDNESSVLTDISAQVTETDGIPLEYDEIEVGGFGTAVKSYATGRADTPVTLKGAWSATIHSMFKTAVGVDTTTKTVAVSYGNNAAPTTGDPKISGEYVVSSYKVTASLDGKQEFEVKMVLGAGQSLPAWGTVA
jgi:hypothetical protein